MFRRRTVEFVVLCFRIGFGVVTWLKALQCDEKDVHLPKVRAGCVSLACCEQQAAQVVELQKITFFKVPWQRKV